MKGDLPRLLMTFPLNPLALKEFFIEREKDRLRLVEASRKAREETRNISWLKAFREGRELGRQQERQRWEAWLQRREEAEANNLPFDEPPPSKAQ